MKNNKLYWLLSVLMCIACKENNTTSKLDANTPMNEVFQLTDKKINSEGVYLFNSERAQIVSWTAHGKNKKETVLKFSFYNRKSKTFEKPKVVIPAKGIQMHAESMAKVGLTKKGVLYAVFRIKDKNSKSMYGGKVYFATSKDKGATWSAKKELVKDPKSTSQSFFDIEQLIDGEIGISWLDNRRIHNNNTGQTLYFAKTNSIDENFIQAQALVGSVCQCCRTDIEINDKKEITIAFRNLIEPNEVLYPKTLKDSITEVRDMYTVTSIDNGVTFSEPKNVYKDNWQINGCPHTGPSIASATESNATTWYSGKNDNEGIFFKSEKSEHKQLISKTGSHPQMITGNDLFYIVYEEYYETENKGYTKIVLQQRTKEKLLKETEISRQNSINDHAVITNIANEKMLVSWINTDTRNAIIEYTTISL